MDLVIRYIERHPCCIALVLWGAPELRIENGARPQHRKKGRRYSAEENAPAARILRAELGKNQGTTTRLTEPLGYGVQPVCSWGRQADIGDGVKFGITTDEQARVRALEQEARERKRANESLKRAASFFGAERVRRHRN